MEKLPISKIVLEWVLVSISAIKSFRWWVVGGVGWGGKVNLMSAPGPCLVQGAIGPGARDRGLALDNNTNPIMF